MISPFFRRALALTPSAFAISRRVSLSFDSRIDCSSAAAATGVPLFSRPCGVTRRVMEFQERVADRCRPKIDPLNSNSHTTENSGCGPDEPSTVHVIDCRPFDATSATDQLFDEPLHGVEVVGHVVGDARAARTDRRGDRAVPGGCPVAASTASGNFAGCAVASATIGPAVRPRPRTAVPRRRRWPCAGRAPSPRRPACGGSRRSSRRRRTTSPGTCRRCTRSRWSPSMSSRPVDPEPAELLGGHATVAAVHLEQQPFEVRRHLDVHRRAQRRHDVTRGHVARRRRSG